MNRKKKYKQTINGLLRTIYDMQTSHSKSRKHSPPTYSIDEFISFMISSDKFAKLYVDWANSSYEKDLRPSANRICDYTEYTLINIEVMTFEENRLLANRDMVSGKNDKQNIKIVKYDMDMNYIEEFHSINEAQRKTGYSHIGDVCKGKRNHAGNFLWRYKNTKEQT